MAKYASLHSMQCKDAWPGPAVLACALFMPPCTHSSRTTHWLGWLEGRRGGRHSPSLGPHFPPAKSLECASKSEWKINAKPAGVPSFPAPHSFGGALQYMISTMPYFGPMIPAKPRKDLS